MVRMAWIVILEMREPSPGHSRVAGRMRTASGVAAGRFLVPVRTLHSAWRTAVLPWAGGAGGRTAGQGDSCWDKGREQGLVGAGWGGDRSHVRSVMGSLRSFLSLPALPGTSQSQDAGRGLIGTQSAEPVPGTGLVDGEGQRWWWAQEASAAPAANPESGLLGLAVRSMAGVSRDRGRTEGGEWERGRR